MSELNELDRSIIAAVDEMAMLKYFPADAAGRGTIMWLLRRIATEPHEVAWLARTMVDRVGEWQGPVELRGVFCTRFKPADGVEADCQTSVGFRPADGELRSLTEHALLTEGEKRLLLAGPREEPDIVTEDPMLQGVMVDVAKSKRMSFSGRGVAAPAWLRQLMGLEP